MCNSVGSNQPYILQAGGDSKSSPSNSQGVEIRPNAVNISNKADDIQFDKKMVGERKANVHSELDLHVNNPSDKNKLDTIIEKLEAKISSKQSGFDQTYEALDNFTTLFSGYACKTGKQKFLIDKIMIIADGEIARDIDKAMPEGIYNKSHVSQIAKVFNLVARNRLDHLILKLVNEGLDGDHVNTNFKSLISGLFKREFHVIFDLLDPELTTKNNELKVLMSTGVIVGNFDIIDWTLRLGVDVNSTFRGNTPLHVAVQQCDYLVFNRLLEEKDIDVNAKTADGKTALMLAKNAEENNMIKKLREAGAVDETVIV